MLVFIVRGLSNSLQFAYVQFPGCDLSGETLYNLFWEAVRRVGNCGSKVLLLLLRTKLIVTLKVLEATL